MTKKIFSLALTVLIIASCGTVKKVEEEIAVTLPTQQEADALVADFLGEETPFVTFSTDSQEGPRVYAFAPLEDSNFIKEIILTPQNGEWQISHSDCRDWMGESGLKFQGFQDTTASIDFYDNGKPVFTFSTLSKSTDKGEYDIFVYNSATGSLQTVSLNGKILSDGRIEGSSNKYFLENPALPELQWAMKRLDNNDLLVELSQAEITTDQAIEWWLEKNPNASSAKKITFGSLPAESSLVSAFASADDKQKSGSYTVALYDHRGYTVIVVRKSTGEYFLAWAEPVCRNKNTDPLLNTVYFEKGSQLAMFYYHGKKTYKLHLNIANGSIYKS